MSECLSPIILEGVRAGTLPPQDQASAEAHLAGCARCREELEALRSRTALSAEVQRPADVASAGGATGLRSLLLPILVGLLCAGLFTFAVGAAAMQRLLYKVHETYANTYPSLDRPRLALSAEGPEDFYKALSLVGLVGYFGMGLFTVLLVRPRDRREDFAAGLLTSMSATLITIPIMAWATVLSLAVVPSLTDFTLFGEATQTANDAGKAKKHPTDVLAEKYPDLAKVPPNERGKKFFPKIVADQVVGTGYGVWSGIWLSLASSGVLALCGTFTAGYLVRRGDGILAILFPYTELTLPLTSLICALFILPFDLMPDVGIRSIVHLALLTFLCFIGVLYHWDWLLRAALYVGYYFFVFGLSEQGFPPILYLAAGAIAFIMMFRHFAPWNRPEPAPVYPFVALVCLPFLALGGGVGAWIYAERTWQNAPVGAGAKTDWIGSLDTHLQAGTVAFAVRLSGEPDYVLPGARVDVVRCLTRAGKGAECACVAQNVLVKAVDMAVERPGDRPTLAAKTATLEVTRPQALLLAAAQENGTVHLVLRRFDDQAILPQLPMAPAAAGVKPPLDEGAAAPAVDEDLPDLPGGVRGKPTPPQGKQTFTLKLTGDKATGGFVVPGSHVDVIYAWPGGEELKHSALLVEDVWVMAVNKETERPEDGITIVPETVTLVVSPKEAALLSQAKKEGAFHLALRSIDDWGLKVDAAPPDKPKP